MANGIKYQAHEILNKVLNAAETGLQVDIVAGAEYAEDSGHTSTDTGNFVLGVRNDTLAALGGTDGDYVPFQMNASGALFVEVSSSGTGSGVHVDDAAFTLGSHSGVMMMGFAGTQSVGSNDAGAIAMETDGSVHIHDGGNTITVDGTVTANLGTTDNAVLDAVAASLSVLDDWDDSNYANVNMNLAGSDAQAGEGTISATTQRVTIATDDDGVAHLATIAGAVSTQMQVDVVAALPAGSNTIGVVDLGSTDNAVLDAIDAVLDTIKVDTEAIETAVELIDDTVAVLGTATYSEATTKGSVVGVVRNDTLAPLAGTDNEIAPLQVNKSGALYTVEETGQLGSIFENTTTVYDTKQIVAIQFLEDTKFTTLTTDSTIFPGTASGDNGIQIDNNDVFPQGMTIFGKWTAFTLASGSVIAYQGAW